MVDTTLLWKEIVITKHNNIGNCLLSNLNGNPESEETKSILGIKILSPMFFLMIIIAVMISWPKSVICKCVTLHKPLSWSIFLK